MLKQYLHEAIAVNHPGMPPDDIPIFKYNKGWYSLYTIGLCCLHATVNVHLDYPRFSLY